MKNKGKIVFNFDNFNITLRELIASFTIIGVMLLLGFPIADSIMESEMNVNEVYNKALKIDNNTSLFQHGMDTNIGNAFVYGDLIAIDPVTFPEIGGEYSYIVKIKEKYTKHYRTVTKTKIVNGKTQTYTVIEEYWTWDEVDRWSKCVNKITFTGVEFDYGKINHPGTYHIDTIKESRKIRYVYKGTNVKHTGTIFADLRNGTIPDSTKFYNGYNIDQTINQLHRSGGVIGFWIIWILLIGGAVFGFFYVDNKWLE